VRSHDKVAMGREGNTGRRSDIRAQTAGMVPRVPSQDLIRPRKLNDSRRLWVGNHQDSSDGRSFEKAQLDGNAIKPYRVMPSDRENDHGEENEVEDQKDEEGEKGRSIAEEEALGGQEEHAEEVGEADAPQGRSPEV
jgi:hypothetical protein